jgi:hypothetical protein
METPQGKPERVYAKVLMGAERRAGFATGDYIVIDRGASAGVTPGTQFVLYRWKKRAPENFLAEIADAVAVEVKDQSATLRLTFTRDAVTVNDLAAIRKPDAPTP